MSRSQRVQQVTIPEPYANADALYRAVLPMKELVEVLAGQRGNNNDRAVTYGEFAPPPKPSLPPAVPETWHALAFQNGWVDYSVPYSPCGYRKLDSGLVLLRGLCQSGTAAAAICTLPAGYRPGIQLLLVAYTNPNTACRLDITTAGVITATGGSNVWLSLNNISFYAEN